MEYEAEERPSADETRAWLEVSIFMLMLPKMECESSGFVFVPCPGPILLPCPVLPLRIPIKCRFMELYMPQHHCFFGVHWTEPFQFFDTFRHLGATDGTPG